MPKGSVYCEDGHYYAVVRLTNDHEYYSGSFKSRSAAYRHSVKETEQHRFAASFGCIYNTRGM